MLEEREAWPHKGNGGRVEEPSGPRLGTLAIRGQYSQNSKNSQDNKNSQNSQNNPNIQNI